MKSWQGSFVASVNALALALSAAPAMAQSAAVDGENEEIVVTAQKREEKLQDVPISIRAMGQKELDRLGDSGLQSFAGFAPSLSLVEQGPSRTQINMRGVSTGDLRFDRPELRETVGLYLDETPISTQIVSPNLGMLDIERVEVLRGPQGTLYGAGSLSGTIRMITRKPDLDSFSGSVAGTLSATRYGGTNYLGEGVLNLPLAVDVAALRVAGYYRRDSGFIDNIFTGEDNINDVKDYGGRASLRIRPSDPLTIDATLVHQRTRQGGEFSFRAEEGDLEETTTIREPSASRLWIASLGLAYDLGPATLNSMTSYFRKRSTFGANAGLFSEVLTGVEDDIDGPTLTQFRQKEFTQELRLSSNEKGFLTYTVGAFFQRQKNGFSQDVTFPGFDAAAGIDSTQFGARPDQIYGSNILLDTKQYALFGEVGLAFTDQLSATLGGRYFDVKQDSEILFFGLLADTPGVTVPFRFKQNGFNPKVNLTYKFDDARLGYVQASKGFRLGGTNEPIPGTCAADLAALGFTAPPPSFKSDTLWNYEAGLKTSWADGKLVVNAAAYRIDWKKPPLAVDLQCGFSTLINAGSFEINGAELDMEARPMRGLVLRAGASFNDGQLSGNLPVLGGVDGDRVPQVPRWTFNASLDYDFPLGFADDARGFFHVDVRHVGNRVTQFPANPNYSGYYRLPAYQLVGLRVGGTFGAIRAEIFADNLLDERAILNKTDFVRAFDENPGTAIFTNRPRTIGVKLAMGF